MPKKFISFLGAIPYEPARYYFSGDSSMMASPTPYVQEAIFEKALADWQPADKVVIFTTEEAKNKNYHHRITRKEGLLENKGLEHVLKRLNNQGQIGSFEAASIPNGNTEEEIWEVFQAVFQHIEDGDELYFDITFGFRSLPMLGIVLLDYARTLRQVEVRKIFYGNFEAGRVRQKPGQLVEAPVLDLTSFAQLQDWTAASRLFLQGGNAEPIADLAEQHNPEISRNLRLFAPAILTCRGMQLARDIDISSFKQLVDTSLGLPIAAQLRPLLSKIQEKLAPFSTGNTRNGLIAVRWCIDNGLIQQGYTFLLETIISLALERIFEEDMLADLNYRNAVSAALNGISPNNKKLRISIPKPEYEFICDYIGRCNGLAELFQQLTGKKGLRNDINHCGFRDTYASPATLKEELTGLYEQFLEIHLF